MAFFTALYKSLYDVAWLKANKENRAGAWKYFFGFTAVLTIGTVAVMSGSLFSEIKPAREKALAAMPEFAAVFKGGELSITGLKQPFTYRGDSKDETKFVVVVDTVSTTTPELATLLDNEESGILITKQKAEFFDAKQQSGRTQYWQNMPDTSFNRARAASLITKFSSPPFLVLLLVIIGLFLFAGLIIGKLFLIIIATLIALIVARLAKRAWQWRELFTVGLFAITLPSLASLVLPFFGVATGHVPFLVLIAFMLALVLTKDEAQAKSADTVQK